MIMFNLLIQGNNNTTQMDNHNYYFLVLLHVLKSILYNY